MCGFVGYWGDKKADIFVAEKMAACIRHRGPDDAGVWLDNDTGLALAHRRLSIIDLSLAGHQPMVSPCGRLILTYNGEIYNHKDLRAELDEQGGGFEWCGYSDTETLLAALRHWGVEGALQRLNGMFAFALWDKSKKTLFLARDRMGEKPLYYGRNGHIFLFGSELKSLKAHPDWCGEVDRDVLALYMRHNYIPAPWSIYQGIRKLPPAHYAAVKEAGNVVSEPVCYWDLKKIAETGVEKAKNATAEELTDELDTLLRDAVGRRMMSDVPLGAFLSGGFDSTTVVALMQSQSRQPVKTFTIGFHEETHNEATHAKAVAKHLGTNHTELYVTAAEAMDVIPNLPEIWDEPFSDSSQIPTYLVSQLTRKHVTVSLSGDGGDELFYGYQRYVKCEQIWRKLRRFPVPIRRTVCWLMAHAPDVVFEKAAYVLPEKYRIKHLADRLPKLIEILDNPTSRDLYRELISHAKNPDKLVIDAQEPDTIWGRPDQWPDLPGLCEQMMYLDSVTYLPDDILAKVDRASMAVSLEGRIPLLDHRVVEFAWKVPMSMKFKDGLGKWLLRKVLYRYVPKDLMERPKMGFGVPIENWLRGPLREWAEELLSEKRLREEGFFDSVPIRQMLHEHISGKRRWHYYLWDILMFQAWLEINKN